MKIRPLALRTLSLFGLATVATGCASRKTSAEAAFSDFLPKKHEITLLQDGSSSSNTKEFEKVMQLTCTALRSKIKSGDTISKIIVSGDKPNFSSPTMVSPVWIDENCSKRTFSSRYGTETKAAFNLYLTGLKGEREHTPVLILQIQANEGENPPPISIWRDTARKITEYGGYIVVIGATNQAGATNFNANFFSATKGFNVLFADTNEYDIKDKITKAMTDR